jgi:hypothetical protein
MIEATFPRACSHARRRWIATRPLADPTRISRAVARRPASTVRAITPTVYVASTI